MYRVSFPQQKNLGERVKLLLCLPCIKFGLDLKINDFHLLSLVEHINLPD